MNENLKRVREDVQQIYSRITDDISRQIFENKLLMALTKRDRDNDGINSLRNKRDDDQRLVKVFESVKRIDGDILIYGAGECGRYIYGSKFMKGIPVQGFIDNKEWRKGTIHNLPVYQFDDAVKKYPKVTVMLSVESEVSRRQIQEQILQQVCDWNIIDVGGILREIDKEGLLGIDTFYDQYIYDLVNTSELASEVFRKIKKAIHPVACWITLSEGDVIGKLIKEKWGYYPWCCYLTNDKKQKEYNGIPVYTYEEAVAQYKQLDIVIESERECKIAREKTSESVAVGECIDLINITETLYRKQYFDFFEYSGMEETFVDAGAYDLGSTEEFLKWSKGNYGKIYAFEPDNSNYKLCKEKVGNQNRIVIFNCGLSDRQGEIGFTSGLGGASRIENQEQDFYADYNIEVMDLDSVIKGEKVTFIKMDIEGAEEKALLGAKHTITEQKPKLAICVYHKPEDIIELPALILAMRPDYKIAFRHYSLRDTETVMYAW